MKKIVVIAPHPDDETLGCGGTLLKHKLAGDEVHWLIMTHVSMASGYSAEFIDKRNNEIERVSTLYPFDSVENFGFRPAYLDTYPMSELIEKISSAFKRIQPEWVFMPFEGDIHSDHKVTCQAVFSCCKSFRYNSIKKVLAYETLSETDFSMNSGTNRFVPNVFIPIDDYLENKIKIMRVYESEIRDFPFPRSERTISSLAALRGANANCAAAESFMLLKEILG